MKTSAPGKKPSFPRSLHRSATVVPSSDASCRNGRMAVRQILRGFQFPLRRQIEGKSLNQAKAVIKHAPNRTPGLTEENDAKRSGGQPLSASERAFFEARFGHDFSRVRVHPNDAQAESQHSAAITCGWEIGFAPGQWKPGTATGRRLIAHELVHVMQQAGSGRGRPIGREEAEKEADLAATNLSSGINVSKFGARPFGLPAAAPPTAPALAATTGVVPAADVERLVQEITRVVVAANLPGIDMAEVAEVLTALRDYGNAGKVVWGDTGDKAYGSYEHVPDVIVLNDDRFNINDPGPVAAVALFHEASHTLRWRTAGRAADAAKTAETGPNPSIEDSYRAAINWELKLYREEVLAYSSDQGVMYSYWAELGIVSRERAIELVKEADPTTGSSAEKSLTRLGKLILEYQARAGRDVELERFLKDAKAWGASGQNMPEFRNYIIP